MQARNLLLALSSLSLVACGSSGGSEPSSSNTSATDPTTGAFAPPAPEAGYTRLVSKSVQVKPGQDVTFCQYIMPPMDHDVDVVDVGGYQSKFGHHAVAFTYTPQSGEQPGSSFECMGTEFSAGDPMGTMAQGMAALASMGSFLGAVGGPSTSGQSPAALPAGVAFRLKTGQGVMLNVHYINTSASAIEGDAVLDLKFAAPDPSRKIAAMFVNLNAGFQLPPMAPTTSSVDCVAQSDVQFLMVSNHMHEWGTSASTQVVHTDGSIEDLHVDNSWSFDMQFNPVYSHWDLDAPYVLKQGDTIRTTCNWRNTTADSIAFPREMCVGVGFALASADNPTAPLCAQGVWLAQGI